MLLSLKQWRKTHRFVAKIIFVPLLITTVTGILLILRGQFEFIQPQTLNVVIEKDQPLFSLEEIMKESIQLEESSISQIIFRPKNGVFLTRFKSGRELQFHGQTGQLLTDKQRRSEWLIDLHEGKIWGINYLVFLPSALGLLYLLVSGLFLIVANFKLQK